MNSKFSFVIAGLFFVLVLSAGGLSAAEKPVSPFEVDRLIQSPVFETKDLKGARYLSSSLRGKVFLLTFWATWCPACTEEMSSLQSLSRNKTFKARGFEVVTVSVDQSSSDTRNFLSKRGMDLLVLVDDRKVIARQFKVFSLPTTFLIDRNGMIVEKFFGEYDWTDKEVLAKIEKLL
jgi:peroxiredoxin